ncbi:DedA family protein [Xanthomonas fragariae]|uniref:DedA family protein n=1 Tax=Xanthomonas fragariae TaxID=48664 RepID=A0A1Y6HAI8_9XANT|nr:DedA family protein [Xanthomonas fragariae]SMQ99551.1 hypothetical protein PD885_02312 [Xanthomonas fragariae]SMR03584.1 DedA family protein [Xanthomonas fragariae]
MQGLIEQNGLALVLAKEQSLCRLSMSRDTYVKKTERFLSRWGVRVLAMAKFVPRLSMVPMAGALRVRSGSILALRRLRCISVGMRRCGCLHIRCRTCSPLGPS